MTKIQRAKPVSLLAIRQGDVIALPSVDSASAHTLERVIEVLSVEQKEFQGKPDVLVTFKMTCPSRNKLSRITGYLKKPTSLKLQKA